MGCVYHCLIRGRVKKSPWLRLLLPVAAVAHATYWSTPPVCCQLSTMTSITCNARMRTACLLCSKVLMMCNNIHAENVVRIAHTHMLSITGAGAQAGMLDILLCNTLAGS